jgi:hydrophobic/amphiphilic exporter-1 (mainly G- bacteria), HAE1 family
VFIENSVRDTLRETLLAVLAVAFVVLLFVGRLGSTFSVVLAIPITLTGAVVLFGVLGFTFNVVTLLAITVAVGLVVDDSIVIAENIDRYRALGLGLKEAVLQGAGEVAGAVLTATLSLLAVFIPIGFLPGVIGQFFSQFGLSLAATIAVSYLEAMFFLTVRLAYLPNPLPPAWRDVPRALRAARGDVAWTLRLWRRKRLALAAVGVAAAVLLATRQGWWPEGVDAALRAVAPAWLGAPRGWPLAGTLAGIALLLAAGLLPPLLGAGRYLGRAAYHLVGAPLRSLHELTDGGVAALREGYADALGWVLDRATGTLVVAALLVGSLGVIFPLISFNFVSPVDAGQVAVRIEMPPGTPLSRTDAVAALAERVVRDHPAVRDVVATVGTGGAFGNPNAVRATVRLELLSGRDASAFEVADALRPRVEAALAAYPEARVSVASDDGGAVPVETGLSLTLVGNDRTLLEARDRMARDVMAENPWLRDVRSSLEGSVAERVFVVSSSALAGTGLTTSEVAGTLRAYNVGVRAGELREAGEETPIVVRVNPAAVADEQTLLSLPIFAPALRSYLPLGLLGRFELRPAPTSIDRANQAYVATVSAEFVEGVAGAVPAAQRGRGGLRRGRRDRPPGARDDRHRPRPARRPGVLRPHRLRAGAAAQLPGDRQPVQQPALPALPAADGAAGAGGRLLAVLPDRHPARRDQRARRGDPDRPGDQERDPAARRGGGPAAGGRDAARGAGARRAAAPAPDPDDRADDRGHLGAAAARAGRGQRVPPAARVSSSWAAWCRRPS